MVSILSMKAASSTINNDKNILVVAKDKDTAKNLVTNVRVMYAGLPSWLSTAVDEDNKLSLRFANGSQIKAIASNESAGRSEALSLLIIDEAAFIDKVDTIWTAAQQTLATGVMQLFFLHLMVWVIGFTNNG